ncbi:MAG: DUF4838 domain-containing protein [Clostridia bacterium]|nr:DUF4838 domain-containing protein [Clostridia bacterium]
MKQQLLSLLIICSILFSMLTSCSEDQPPSNTTDTVSGSETQISTDTDAPEEEFIPHYTYTPTVAQNPDLYIVEDGTSDYVIVRGENASPSEVTAANELQLYIEKISGATLPIVLDTEAPAAHEIVVGKTNRETDGQFDREELGDEGFVIDITEDTVWLVGGELRGTLYCVYTFLEEHLGCRFFSQWEEIVPTSDTLGLVVGRDQQVPVIYYRTTSWRPVMESRISAQMKINSRWWTGGEEYGNNLVWAGGDGFSSHTLSRILYGGNNVLSDPCLSSEENYINMLANVRAMLEETPADIISLSQSDGGVGGVCPCDVCAASIEEHGYSGHYLKFVNRIAEELADEYPDVLFHTFAYQFTVMVPKSDIVPADNVAVQLCTINNCHSHPLAEYVYLPQNEDNVPGGYTFEQLIEEWSAICDNLWVWDYTTNFCSYSSINPYIHNLYDNMQLFIENDVYGYYMQGCDASGSPNGEFAELRAYLIGKLLWDPYMTREEFENYMNGFLCDYYGPGWEYIRAFIDLAYEQCECEFTFEDPDDVFPDDIEFVKNIIEEQVDLSDLTTEQIKNPADVDWLKYYEQIDEKDRYFNETLARGYEYFAKAAALAETDEQRTRIDRASIQLDVNFTTLVYNVYQPEAYFLKLIYKTALDREIAAGKISDVDGYTYTYRFEDAILDPYYKSRKQYMIDFNEALYHKMQKHNIQSLFGNDVWSADKEPDFSNPPCGAHLSSYYYLGGWFHNT